MWGIIGSGQRNTNSAYYGTIGGGRANQAESDYSTIPGGRGAKTRSYGQMAYASGTFGDYGDAQLGIYVLRGTSVGANLGQLYLDDSSGNITIPARGSFLLDIDVVARAGTKVNGWYGNFFHTRIAAENQGGNLVMETLGESSLTTHNPNVVIAYNSSGNQFLLYGQGETGETIHWVATVRVTELVKPE